MRRDLGRGEADDGTGRGDFTGDLRHRGSSDDLGRGGSTDGIRHATLRREAASLTATVRRARSAQLGGSAGEGAR